MKSRDSSVGIALGYGLDDRGSGVQFAAGLGIFLFTTASRTALGPTQPPFQWGSSRGSPKEVKRPGREADHSPPSSAEVKVHGAVPPLIQYAFMAWCSVKMKAQGQLLPLPFTVVYFQKVVSLENYVKKVTASSLIFKHS
jgi:hypothetical protein